MENGALGESGEYAARLVAAEVSVAPGNVTSLDLRLAVMIVLEARMIPKVAASIHVLVRTFSVLHRLFFKAIKIWP